MFSYHQVEKGVVPSSHYKSAKKLLELLRACPLLAVFLLVSAKIKEECQNQMSVSQPKELMNLCILSQACEANKYGRYHIIGIQFCRTYLQHPHPFHRYHCLPWLLDPLEYFQNLAIDHPNPIATWKRCGQLRLINEGQMQYLIMI